MLGDAVNLSSRLEGQAKFYGCPIVVGEEPAFAALAEAHAEIIQAYRSADSARAAEHLDRCQARTDGLPLAKLYDIYAERLASNATNPDIEHWDGVYEALQK